MAERFIYRCEATSVEGFIQQLAVSYVRNGYFFYVTGSVREGRDPSEIDRKLIERYGIDVSKFTRARRKKAGLANIHYLRHKAVLRAPRHVGQTHVLRGRGKARSRRPARAHQIRRLRGELPGGAGLRAD